VLVVIVVNRGQGCQGAIDQVPVLVDGVAGLGQVKGLGAMLPFAPDEAGRALDRPAKGALENRRRTEWGDSAGAPPVQTFGIPSAAERIFRLWQTRWVGVAAFP